MDFRSIILFVAIIVFVKLLFDYLYPDPKKALESRMVELKLSSSTQKEREKEMSLISRIYLTFEYILLKAFGDKFQKIFSESTKLKLQKAGQGDNVEQFYAKKIIFAAFLGVFMMVVRPEFLAIIFGMIVGFVYPDYKLKKQIEKRRQIIKEEIPEFFDLMVATYPSTSGFDEAVRKIVERGDGVLVDEFRLYLSEKNSGKTTRDALLSFAERCDTKEVDSFVRQVINSEKLGTELADTLKEQADKMRGLKKEIAEIKAKNASKLLLLPTILLFIAIIVVLMGPSILDIIEGFGSF